MSVTSGSRLGPYEVIAPLGSGGMGEVFRARDSRLGREVAIKVLPQHLSANPEIRARFEREAKTVSSLNHPNICTLFDVGREGETDYLVMELVEGETLADRLTKGALPLPEVLRIGGQIADALDRAHRAGIIHRDLKPGNVMLTKSGAKLMDFGLARATGLAGPAGSGLHTAMTQSPTAGQPLTAEGTIVGTFQYMSPEQLEGTEADARSDLWSLGCVLFEMTTGRRAFEGRSQASLISAIMSHEPPPVSQLAPLSPPALDRLVTRCLAKDPDDRWQTARDLMHELRAIAGVSTSVSGASVMAPAPVLARRSSPLPWVVAGIALIAALALAFVVLNRRPPPDHPVQLSLLPPDGVQLHTFLSTVSISPDGRNVAYCAIDADQTFAVYLQSLDAPAPVKLMRVGGWGTLFWAPDGRTLGVLDQGGRQLATVPASGGTPTVLCATAGSRGGSWSQKGVIVFAPRTSGGLFRIAASGGPDPVQVTWPDSSRNESAHRFPCFLPDGEHFLFASLPQESEGFPIYVGSLGSREVRRIMNAGSAAMYAEPGYLLFRRSGKLMAQRFDAQGLQLEGDPVALIDAPAQSELDGENIATASTDGRLVMLDVRTPDTRLEWFSSDGASLGALTLPPGRWGRPELSPDDRFAVVAKGNDLWSVDLTRSVAVRLTSSPADKSEAIWSPDGRRIAYTERRGREEIVVINADGSGQAQVLATTDDLFKIPEDWSPQGLVFNGLARETLRDLWLTTVDGGKPAPLIQTSAAEWRARVSPDGHWIAYLSNEAGGQDDVYIQSFPVPGHKVRVSTTGAGRIWWMPGSDEIWYGGTTFGQLSSVKLTRQGDELVVGEPRVVFRYPRGATGTDVTRDGRRLLLSVAQTDRQGSTMRVILDWTALAKP